MPPRPTRVASIAVGAAALAALGALAAHHWFGTRATMADLMPDGFAGTPLDEDADDAHSMLGERDDGTPIFTADAIRFEDARQGSVVMPRPAVSLAEADRLGHNDDLRTPDALNAYCMRGPIAAGLTDVDGQWLVELSDRHEDPEMKARAIAFIGLAIGLEMELGVNSYSAATRQRMVDAFAAALISDNLAIQRAALSNSAQQFWADDIPEFTELLRRVAQQRNENAAQAAHALEQAFGIRVPE